MSYGTNLHGNIYVSHRAIATIAYQSTLESYGVVGFAPKNLIEGLSQAIVKDPQRGVEVHFDGKAIRIDLFVMVEYGTRITSVTNSVSNNVSYQVQKALGIPVSAVNIHVHSLRISDMD